MLISNVGVERMDLKTKLGFLLDGRTCTMLNTVAPAVTVF